MKIYKTIGTISVKDYIEVKNSTPEVVINDIQYLFSYYNYSKKELINMDAYKEYIITK